MASNHHHYTGSSWTRCVSSATVAAVVTSMYLLLALLVTCNLGLVKGAPSTTSHRQTHSHLRDVRRRAFEELTKDIGRKDAERSERSGWMHAVQPPDKDYFTARIDRAETSRYRTRSARKTSSNNDMTAAAKHSRLATKLLEQAPSIGRQVFERMARQPAVECPPTTEGMPQFTCPSPDYRGRYHCISDKVLCDGRNDCPSKEDEDKTICMFHKMTLSYFKVLTDAVFGPPLR